MRSFALLTCFLIYLPPIFFQPFCGILLWTWFSIMNPHRLVWGIGASIPYAFIIGAATILAWLVSREPKTPPHSAVSVAFIGLIVTVSISSVFALAPDMVYEKWDRVIKTLIMCVLTLAMLTNKVRIHAFIWVMVLSLGYYGVKGGIFAAVTGGNYRVWGPDSSYISDNNHISLALVIAIPLMHYLQLQSKHLWVRWGLIGMQLCSLVAALASYSRGSFLGLVVMGCIFWWRSPKKVTLAALLLCVGGAVMLMAPDKWFERMNTIETYQEDASAMQRMTIWKVGLTIFADNPIFGGGFRATYSQPVVDRYAPGKIPRAVHNSHLEVLIENGIVGFLFHLILVGATWIYGARVRRFTRNRPDMLWAFHLASMIQTSLLGYLVGGTFVSLGYYDGWYSIPIAMAAVHTLILRQAKQQSIPQVPDFAPGPFQGAPAASRVFRRTN